MKQLFLALSFFVVFAGSAQIPNKLTPAEKVFGLSKIWEEANYNFVYMYRVDRAGWDSAYLKMISEVEKTRNDYEYYRLIQRFCALLKDGHSNVFLPSNLDSLELVTMFGEYRLFVENIEGKAIVLRTNAGKKNEIPVGSEIVEVNGMPVKEYIRQNVAPFISASTVYGLEDLCMTNLLKGLKGEKFTIKIVKPGGSTVTLQLTHIKTVEKECYPPFETKEELLTLKWYKGKVAYLALNSFNDPKIDTLFLNLLPELYTAKALIIDLRKNGGGNTAIGTFILQYLTNDTLLYGARSFSRLHIPAYKAWGAGSDGSDTVNGPWHKKVYLAGQDKLVYTFDYEADTIRLNAKRLVVPTVILTDHNTFSAAEDFLIYADKQKYMIKMGENSAGSTGQPYFFKLPGGGGARVCAKKDTYADGREFVGYGVKPDIEVKHSVSDLILMKDTQLETALNYLAKRVK